MINFNIEPFNKYIEEIKPILFNHWKEVAKHQDKVPLDPDYDKYQLLDDLGMLHSVIARDEDNNIIGYFICFVQPHIHYASTLHAANDILYVKPELRKTGLAVDMFKFAESTLKDKGVDVLTVHMKVYQPFEELCLALGMDKTEYMYSKYIGD